MKTEKILPETVLKFDLRGEMGVATEQGRQAIPVVANECIVRAFYFIRHFAREIRERKVLSLEDMRKISWEKVKPTNNPSIARMLTIATGVFTFVDVGDAAVSQKYLIAVNYAGIGRFAVAIGEDITWGLKARDVKKIRRMYGNVKRFSYTNTDNKIYEKIGSDMGLEKFGLTQEQIEILYNLEYWKTENNIQKTKIPVKGEAVKALKQEWLNEWKAYITNGFSDFLQVKNAKIHWYSETELLRLIAKNRPENTWFRMVLLEAMLFEPYFHLSLETDKKGRQIPSPKYKSLEHVPNSYQVQNGDDYLEELFAQTSYYEKGYVKRLRRCYKKVMRELNEVLKTALTSIAIMSTITIAVVATAGAFSSAIAVALVGTNFSGLSGAALTSACLAYLGGGAIAAGGAGMAGGTMAIVGGGAVLGLSAGAGVGGAVGAISLMGKEEIILQSAKLLVSIREIFLNDEHDIAYSQSLSEQYTNEVIELEHAKIALEHQADAASGVEKKEIEKKIRHAEENIEAMKVAEKGMRKFISSFEMGVKQDVM